MLLVERTVATPPAEGVGLGVPLTVGHRIRLLRKRGAWHWTNSPEGGGTYAKSGRNTNISLIGSRYPSLQIARTFRLQKDKESQQT